MQALITDHYDTGHILLCLQVSCQPCRWHTICIVASLCFMSQVGDKSLASLTSITMLPEATGTDSATARHVCLHAMLALTRNRRRCDKHFKASKAEKHVIMKVKLLWHLLVCNMRPTITGLGAKRAAVGGHIANSEGLCVAHGITISGDHLRCKHGSLFTMMPITFFYSCK